MPDNDILVADNFQPVPGVDYGEPAVEAAPEAQPVVPSTVNEPEPTEPVKVEPETPVTPTSPVELESQAPVERQKPRPIATLLEKKHEAEQRAETAEALVAELQAKLGQAAQAPAIQSDDDVKALAQEYGLDENLLARIVNTARAGVKPELPQEVQDLLAERQANKVQQEEMSGFNTRIDSLAKALPNEQFADPAVKEKLLALAYSTEKAPDGEPYFKKELSELYFAYIKPEIEAGKPSAEASQGGTPSAAVLDFEEIYNRDNPKDIDAMDSETFSKYNNWVKQHKETKSPIKRS